jgi:hypothetical protein
LKNYQNWINPIILRELKSVFKERYDKTGEQDWLEKAKLLEGIVNEFEESILNEILSEALVITEVDKMYNDTEKIESFLTKVREPLIESILSNHGNSDDILDLANKTIKAEKESGLYDPANWSAIF